MASKTASASPTNGTSASAISNSPSYEDIARRSYELYLARGGQPSALGQDIEDWLRAEAELSGRLA